MTITLGPVLPVQPQLPSDVAAYDQGVACVCPCRALDEDGVHASEGLKAGESGHGCARH